VRGKAGNDRALMGAVLSAARFCCPRLQSVSRRLRQQGQRKFPKDKDLNLMLPPMR